MRNCGLEASETEGTWRGRLWAWVLAVVFFLVGSVGLGRQEFSNGSELLNVQTVLEMRRGGTWWVPTLREMPRRVKPPLTAWVTAACVSPATVAALDNPDPVARDAAYRRLAWEVRWHALALTALAMLATFELGRMLLGWRAGLVAMGVFGTSVMALRFGRTATTDVQLTTWVAWTNVGLVAAVLSSGGKRAACCAGAGLALGLAFMSKGPVALAQTLLPVAVWAGVWAWRDRSAGAVGSVARAVGATGATGATGADANALRGGDAGAGASSGGSGAAWTTEKGDRGATPGVGGRRGVGGVVARWWVGGVVLVVCFAAVGLPWYADQLRLEGRGLLATWKAEVSRVGATDRPPDPVYSYLSYFGLMAPWTVFMLAGTWAALAGEKRRSDTDREGLTRSRREERACGPCGGETPPPPTALDEGARTVQDPYGTSGGVLRRAWSRGRDRGLTGALALAYVPVLVMALAQDKNERYLMPMAAGASLVCAAAIVRWYREANSFPKALLAVRDGAMLLPWGMGAGVAVAGALGGAAGATLGMSGPDGQGWHSWAVGGAALGGVVALGVWARWAARRWWAASFAVAAVAAMIGGLLFVRGYADQPGGGRGQDRPLAEWLRRELPGRPVVELNDTGVGLSHELSIYLNRVVRRAKPAEVAGLPREAVLLQVRRASSTTRPELPQGYTVRGEIVLEKRRAWVLVRE